MISIIYSFTFFFSFLFISETVSQEIKKEKPIKKTIYIVNVTGKKIRAIFKPVTTTIESEEIEQVCYNPEHPMIEEHSLDEFMQPTPYSMEFGLCLAANKEKQKIVLEQKQLGTKDLFEGILDWSTATICTLLLYDNKKEKIIKKDFTIKDGVTYQISYKNNNLSIKNIN